MSHEIASHEIAPRRSTVESDRADRVCGTRPSDASRRGFTLIELMVAIAVMGILASVMLGALWKASITAKEMRTRSLVAKLNNHIVPRWESYRSRRLLFDPTVLLNPGLTTLQQAKLSSGQIITWNAVTGNAMKWVPGSADFPLSRRQTQALRLMAIRELMRIEMPQRFRDISLDNGSTWPPSPWPPSSSSYIGPLIIPSRTSMSQNYRVKMNLTMPTAQYESAECLYQLVTLGMEDTGLGPEHFSQSDVGDQDKDGWPEFLDAWGNPIFFLRWAPHFFSPLQPFWYPGDDGVLGPNPNNSNINDDPATPRLDPFYGVVSTDPANPFFGKMRGVPNVAANHDPYDLMQDDHDAFALTPLIYSAGADGIFDIAVGDYSVGTSAPFSVGALPYNSPFNYFDPDNLYNLLHNHQTSDIGTANNPNGTRDFYNPTAFGHPPFAGGALDLTNDSFTSSGPANGKLNHWDNIHNHVLGR